MIDLSRTYEITWFLRRVLNFIYVHAICHVPQPMELDYCDERTEHANRYPTDEQLRQLDIYRSRTSDRGLSSSNYILR